MSPEHVQLLPAGKPRQSRAYYALAGGQEFHGEAVGAGGYACRQTLHSLPNLVLARGCVEISEVGSLDKLLQVDGAISGQISPEQSVEVKEGFCRHGLRVSRPSPSTAMMWILFFCLR